MLPAGIMHLAGIWTVAGLLYQVRASKLQITFTTVVCIMLDMEIRPVGNVVVVAQIQLLLPCLF